MANTPIILSDRIKAFFAKDKNAFWFHHYTSEEKALKRMDAWQLAKVIHEAHVRNTVDWEEKRIVAEHLLSVRLAQIQARPNYIALGIAIVVGIGSAFLTSALQKPQEQPKCICESQRAGGVQNTEPISVGPKAPAITKQLDIQKGIDAQNAGQPNEKNKP